MRKKASRLNNPFFNEFVFLVIVSAPQELKNKLPLELLKFTTTVEKAKGFADRASYEIKFEMLARLGGAFSITVSPPGYLSKEKLDEVLSNYIEGQRSKDVDEMIKMNVFVQTDKEIMAVHSIMAMNCHNPTYMLNRDFSFVAAEIASGSEIKTRINGTEQVKAVMEDHKLLCKAIMYVLLNQNFVDMNGFRAKDILVLLFLFINRTSYVSMEDIQEFFKTVYTAQVISRTLYKLTESFYILQFPRQSKYTIASLGIQVIANFVNRVTHQAIYF